MTPEELRELIALPENPKLDFKQEVDGFDIETGKFKSDINKSEFIKDIISLANGNATYNWHSKREPEGKLIIGVKEGSKKDGIPPEFYDTGDLFRELRDERIYDIVNEYLLQKLQYLETEVVRIDNKNIFIISIPPHPYIFELSKDLKTKGKNYTSGSVIIRRGQSVSSASVEEINNLRKLKELYFSEIATVIEKDIPPNPYKGLSAFTEEDQNIFFGRDEDCNEVVKKLRHAALIILEGHSGCGKSSLIHAGIKPTRLPTTHPAPA